MDDFSFGTLATTAQRLARLRLERSGITHLNRIEPRDPEPGQPVTVWTTVGANLLADRVTLYYTLDGSEPQGSRGHATVGSALALEPVGENWDLLDWNYTTRWRTVIPAQSDGTKLTYKIGAWSRRGVDETFADNQAGASQLATRFAYHVDSYRAPDWIWDAAIYHLFVDRFYPGDGKKFLDAPNPREFCGGTLRGVIDKLGYLSDLGVNCVWLSPFFASSSYHGYDTVDYLKVEPRLGTNQDFFELVRRAHECGIRVLIDFVPNHTSNEHPHFAAAQSDQTSPFYEWYTFHQWPHEYAKFFTSGTLPQVNLEHAEARRWMIDAARYWLEVAGADGYRLDYADGPSHNFWVDFRRATRAVAPACFTVGELVEAADVVRSYEGRLDGSLDFMFLDVLRRFFAYESLDAAQFDEFLVRHDAYFGRDFVRPTFLDNHDMNRMLWVLQNDSARLRLAATCQFTLPQPPIVYYGTEVGMSQGYGIRDPLGFGDAEARRTMWWDERQDRELWSFYQQLFRLRQKHPALRRGERISLYADALTNVMVYALAHAGDQCIVALNNSAEPHEVTIPLEALSLHDGSILTNEFDSSQTRVESGALSLRLAPRAAVVLSADEARDAIPVIH